jgi:Fe-Mn family superoxide dismutase
MVLALTLNFGGVEQWSDAFSAVARAHAGEPGRVELSFVPANATLVNRWRSSESVEDDVALFAMPTVADVKAFIASIDWAPAYLRYTEAVHAASQPFAAHPADVGGHVLLDVRRAGVFDAATTQLPGAAWRDPASVSDWAGQLPAGCAVIVYCVYGHEVGRVTAMRLQARGINARFLEGGIDAWQKAGHTTVAKGEVR